MTDQSWYVFRSAPQREIATARLLRQYGIPVVCLMRPELKRAHRKHSVKTVPAKRQPLPALRPYIFCEMSSPTSWHRISLCPANVRLVRIDGKARPLSAAGVAYITSPSRGMFKDTETPKAFREPSAEPLDYAVDDLVQIYGAGMDGLRGRVIDICGDGAKVLLPLFGAEREVKIPLDAAVKAA